MNQLIAWGLPLSSLDASQSQRREVPGAAQLCIRSAHALAPGAGLPTSPGPGAAGDCWSRPWTACASGRPLGCAVFVFIRLLRCFFAMPTGSHTARRRRAGGSRPPAGCPAAAPRGAAARAPSARRSRAAPARGRAPRARACRRRARRAASTCGRAGRRPSPCAARRRAARRCGSARRTRVTGRATCSAKISSIVAPSAWRAICRSAAFRSGIASHVRGADLLRDRAAPTRAAARSAPAPGSTRRARGRSARPRARSGSRARGSPRAAGAASDGSGSPSSSARAIARRQRVAERRRASAPRRARAARRRCGSRPSGTTRCGRTLHQICVCSVIEPVS